MNVAILFGCPQQRFLVVGNSRFLSPKEVDEASPFVQENPKWDNNRSRYHPVGQRFNIFAHQPREREGQRIGRSHNPIYECLKDGANLWGYKKERQRGEL